MIAQSGDNINSSDDDIRTHDVRHTPAHLLDRLIQYLHLESDAELARLLDVTPPVISKIRHGKITIGASMLIRMYEVSDISIWELRRLMGDTREKFIPAGRRDD